MVNNSRQFIQIVQTIRTPVVLGERVNISVAFTFGISCWALCAMKRLVFVTINTTVQMRDY
jgi:hypothetical protein